MTKTLALAFGVLFLSNATQVVLAEEVTELTYSKATAKGTKAFTCKQSTCEITGFQIDLTKNKVVVFDPKIYVESSQRVSVVADGKSEFKGFVLNENGQKGSGPYLDIFGKKRNSTRGYAYIDAQEKLCTADISGAVDYNCEIQPLVEFASGTYPMDQNDMNSFTPSYGVLNAVLVGNNTGSQADSFFPKGINAATLNLENDLSSLIFRVEHGDKAISGLYTVTIRIAKNVKVTPPPAQKPAPTPTPTPSPSPSPSQPKKPPSDDPYDDDFDPSDFDL